MQDRVRNESQNLETRCQKDLSDAVIRSPSRFGSIIPSSSVRSILISTCFSPSKSEQRPRVGNLVMAEPQDLSGDCEIDTEAAMREMMGFNSFTTRPKKQTGKSTFK